MGWDLPRGDHHYTGYNRALGKHIRSRAHYIEEMKQGGYVPQEVGDQQVKDYHDSKPEYTPSKDAHQMIEACRIKANKDGSLNVPEKVIDGWQKMGMTFDKDKMEDFIGRGGCI